MKNLCLISQLPTSSSKDRKAEKNYIHCHNLASVIHTIGTKQLHISYHIQVSKEIIAHVHKGMVLVISTKK